MSGKPSKKYFVEGETYHGQKAFFDAAVLRGFNGQFATFRKMLAENMWTEPYKWAQITKPLNLNYRRTQRARNDRSGDAQSQT